MRAFHFISAILVFFSFDGFTQTSKIFTNKEENLRKSITLYTVIETEFTGSDYTIQSKIWPKADSLFNKLPLNKVIACFQDSSPVLKFYAFLKILDLNDDLAFIGLKKMIHDTVRVNWSLTDAAGNDKLTSLLLDEYWAFIDMKYHEGGKISMINRYYFGPSTYFFKKTPLSLWQKKNKDLNSLRKEANN
jgi:hypothetical protein